MFFDYKAFSAALTAIAERYERTAPTVDDWCNLLAAAKGDKITVADLNMVQTLLDDEVHPNTAANMVYHLNYRLGRDTTGQAGF